MRRSEELPEDEVALEELSPEPLPFWVVIGKLEELEVENDPL